MTDTAPGRSVVKTRSDAPAGFFEAEASGLVWLGEARDDGGVDTVRVVDVGPGRIVLERIPTIAPDREAAHAFGAALAITHDAGAGSFGAPPPGGFPLFIGRRPQPSARERTWGRFYARDRVLPFIPLAVSSGALTAREAALVDAACGLVASGAFDDDDSAARIHGDLWNGNVLWSPRGVVLIDPAAHGGHRETDLAMLDLFGLPYLDAVEEGYEERHPLREGWRDRRPVHQLHPLAVHAAGHGRSYGEALVGAARHTLALG